MAFQDAYVAIVLGDVRYFIADCLKGSLVEGI